MRFLIKKCVYDEIMKAFEIGTIREWNGVQYKKISPTEWKPVGNSKTKARIEETNSKKEVSTDEVKKILQDKNRLNAMLDMVWKETGSFSMLSPAEKEALNYAKKYAYNGISDYVKQYEKDKISVEVAKFKATVKENGETIGEFSVSIKYPENNKKKVEEVIEKKSKGYAARLRDDFNKNTDRYLTKDFKNKSTGISAKFSTESQKELRSRTDNTKANGFTLAEHFEVAKQIKELFENATLEKTHDDTKHNQKNVKIERYLSPVVILKSGKKAQACITIKHSLDKDGRIIYSIEAMDIKNALAKTRAKGQPKKELSNTSNNIQQNTNTVKKSFSEHISDILKGRIA